MTAQEFLVLLKEHATKTQWQLCGGAVRSADYFCPMCFLAKERGQNPLGYKTSVRGTTLYADLGAELVCDITYAADTAGESEYRKQLLEAVGL